jgi:hypothetical protein
MELFTFRGMSAPFAQAVAGRMLGATVTPLSTPKAQRTYTLSYMPAASTPSSNATADGGAASAATVGTEIIVNAMWLEQAALHVTVLGGGEAVAKVTVESWAGAQLNKDVSYEASVRVSVLLEAVAEGPVTITLSAKPA